MPSQDATSQVQALRRAIRGDVDDDQRLTARELQYEADRQHLLECSDNINLVPSQLGDHRHLKILRHVARIAEHADPPTVADFDDNDEAADTDIETDADVEALLQFVELETAFRFLHVMTRQVAQVDAIGQYHLSPEVHVEQTLATSKSLFDSVVEASAPEA